VPQHDGSVLQLRKLHADYDPGNRIAAMNFIQERQARGEVVTGLLYLEPGAADLHQHLQTVATPFNRLGVTELCPGADVLARVNASLR
jgi:2-oxoglutarate ferredoxin oxidoreductase subunit beta